VARRWWQVTLAGAGGSLLAGALAACGSAGAPVPALTAHAAFAGYKWSVVSIGHDGRNTAIPASYSVYLEFTPDGQFMANEPVNGHSGSYRLTGDGFIASDVAQSLVGYTGADPVVLLAQRAISSFNVPANATASVTGNRLTVVISGYTLICQRDGKQADWPAPSPT
jgi:hypothetical protein